MDVVKAPKLSRGVRRGPVEAGRGDEAAADGEQERTVYNIVMIQ